jgi:hypothetical protein
MKSPFRGVLVVLLLIVSGSFALAAPPSWTFVEAGYLNVDPDNFSESGDNVFAGASFGFMNNWHVSGRYIDGDYSDNVDLSYWTVAGGWHGLLGENGDILAEITWNDQEVSNVDDDGVGANAGVRWRLLKILELDGLVHWTDYDNAGSTDSYEARGIVYLWKIGIGAAVEFGDDADVYNAFVRFHFDEKK